MEAALQTQALPPSWCCSSNVPSSSLPKSVPHPSNWVLMSLISFSWCSSISFLRGQKYPSCLVRNGDCRGGLLHSAPSCGEGLSCLRPHKLKAIHTSVCFVNMKVQHKAFRHQLNLDITVFIVMNNKSFSPALQQQGIIQQKFNF